MFRFAHFVFGTEIDQNVSNANNYNINDCVQRDIDDDWILIDVPLNSNAEKENNDRGLQLIAANQTTICSVPDCIADDAHQLIQDINCNRTEPESPTQAQAMDESWFVTPPPCFNSLSSPIMIETTPFENLLIEHPSMSVFGPSLPPRNHISLPSDSLSSSLSTPTDTSSDNSTVLSNQQQERQTRRQRRQQNIQNRINNNNNQSNINLHLRTAVLDEFQVLSSMQSREVAQIQKLITKSNMDRQNKVLFQRNRPLNRRAKMVMRPNGICNNRKNC